MNNTPVSKARQFGAILFTMFMYSWLISGLEQSGYINRANALEGFLILLTVGAVAAIVFIPEVFMDIVTYPAVYAYVSLLWTLAFLMLSLLGAPFMNEGWFLGLFVWAGGLTLSCVAVRDFGITE